MDAGEIEEVRASLRGLLAEHGERDLPQALIATGWLELILAEPRVAIGVLAEEQGIALSDASALDLVLAHGAGLAPDAESAFVLPPPRRGAALAARIESGVLRVDGIARGVRSPARWLVPCDEGIMAIDGAALRAEPVRGSDPGLGLARVRGEIPRARASGLSGPDAWPRALAVGRLALAGEMLGSTDRMLAIAVDYVGARKQFGRALGSFQAVKHRLADVRVALGGARAALDAAWDAGDATSAMAAKILAARAHRLASLHCHQVMGGIAFTLEQGFHRWIERGHSLDALLGPARELTRELGQQLIEARRVPRVPPIAQV